MTDPLIRMRDVELTEKLPDDLLLGGGSVTTSPNSPLDNTLSLNRRLNCQLTARKMENRYAWTFKPRARNRGPSSALIALRNQEGSATSPHEPWQS
jgi:hypothetical protein